jgi:hypothetical protein
MRPLTGSDWERLAFYAKRVKYLELPCLDFQIYRRIIFPALIGLVITKWPAGASATICKIICSTHLRSLYMTHNSLTTKSVIHLSNLPHLQELSAKITLDNEIRTPLEAVSRDYCFPALLNFHLRADSWTHAIDFFAAYMHHSPLQIIEMEVEQVPSQQELTRLLDTVLDCCLPSSLRQLVLRPDDDAEQPDDPTCVLESHAIRRLFAFPNLEVLRISLAISFEQIDDPLVKDMASAWPQLQQLELQFSPWGMAEQATRTTIYGLLPLAECSHLTSLLINVNASVPDLAFLAQRDGLFYNSSLSYLAVGYSPIGDSVAVASFLSNFFPNLKDIMAWGNIDGDDDLQEEEGSAPMLWQQVRNFFQPFVAIRRQERVLAGTTQPK